MSDLGALVALVAAFDTNRSPDAAQFPFNFVGSLQIELWDTGRRTPGRDRRVVRRMDRRAAAPRRLVPARRDPGHQPQEASSPTACSSAPRTAVSRGWSPPASRRSVGARCGPSATVIGPTGGSGGCSSRVFASHPVRLRSVCRCRRRNRSRPRRSSAPCRRRCRSARGSVSTPPSSSGPWTSPPPRPNRRRRPPRSRVHGCRRAGARRESPAPARAFAANVFRGMGSWNDIGPPAADAAEYEAVSQRLFTAMLDAIVAAVNGV